MPVLRIIALIVLLVVSAKALTAAGRAIGEAVTIIVAVSPSRAQDATREFYSPPKTARERARELWTPEFQPTPLATARPTHVPTTAAHAPPPPPALPPQVRGGFPRVDGRKACDRYPNLC